MLLGSKMLLSSSQDTTCCCSPTKTAAASHRLVHQIPGWHSYQLSCGVPTAFYFWGCHPCQKKEKERERVITTMIWPYFVLVLVSEPPWVMGPLLLWFDVKKNWYFLCNAGLFPESCLFLVKMNWPPDIFVWLLQNSCVPKGSECSSCNGKFMYVEMNGLAEICWNE